MSDVQQLDTVPKLSTLYAKAAVAGLRSGGDTLPDTEVVVDDVTVDRQRLAAYDRVCGYRFTDVLSPTYLHAVAYPLAIQIVASGEFPFPGMGIVHVGNRIEHHRPIGVDETLRLRARTENLREHPKGRQFDLVLDAEVDGEVVWTEVATALNIESKGSSGGTSDRDREGADASATPTARWRVPKDLGRRYAAVSGDYNPIHLYPLTARALGFPRPIAHGMWTKARALAAMEGRLPESFTAQVEFKAPLLLPATVDFRSRRHGDVWNLEVVDARKGKPHLQGTVTPR